MPPTPHNIHPKTRLYVEDPLGEGQSVGLDHERAHFLRHVLRLDKGDMVAVFNGRDGEWLAAIDGFGKGWCSLSIVAQRREQRCDPDLWLLFAPIKRARIDSIAEKASELGVSRLWPVFTRRTDPARVNLERLRANAIEAAEQCERLTVPECPPRLKWTRFQPSSRGWGAGSSSGRSMARVMNWFASIGRTIRFTSKTTKRACGILNSAST